MRPIGNIYASEYDAKLTNLLHLVCGYFNITVEQIASKGRTRPLPDARAVFLKYATETYDLNPGAVLRYVNRNRSLFYSMKQKTENEYDLKPVYMKFLLFMKDKNVTYFLSKVENYELRLKLEYISKTIESRFKTRVFRNMFENKIKDIIFLIQGQNKQLSLMNIYSWFTDYVNEFHEGNQQLLDEFDRIGVS